jgi:hypothetical protein
MPNMKPIPELRQLIINTDTFDVRNWSDRASLFYTSAPVPFDLKNIILIHRNHQQTPPSFGTIPAMMMNSEDDYDDCY